MNRTQNVIAALIGGGFGLDFVLPNLGAPLTPVLATIVRILSLVTFVALATAIALNRRSARPERRRSAAPEPQRRNLFGRGYWWIVVSEVALIVAGRQAILAMHAPPQAAVAWTALVVGAHFLAFVAFGVWGGSVRVLGLTIAGLGALGLLLSATPAVAWVPDVSGVLSGFSLLLGSLIWVVRDMLRGAGRGATAMDRPRA